MELIELLKQIVKHDEWVKVDDGHYMLPHDVRTEVEKLIAERERT